MARAVRPGGAGQAGGRPGGGARPPARPRACQPAHPAAGGRGRALGPAGRLADRVPDAGGLAGRAAGLGAAPCQRHHMGGAGAGCPARAGPWSGAGSVPRGEAAGQRPRHRPARDGASPGGGFRPRWRPPGAGAGHRVRTGRDPVTRGADGRRAGRRRRRDPGRRRAFRYPGPPIGRPPAAGNRARLPPDPCPAGGGAAPADAARRRPIRADAHGGRAAADGHGGAGRPARAAGLAPRPRPAAVGAGACSPAWRPMAVRTAHPCGWGTGRACRTRCR